MDTNCEGFERWKATGPYVAMFAPRVSALYGRSRCVSNTMDTMVKQENATDHDSSQQFKPQANKKKSRFPPYGANIAPTKRLITNTNIVCPLENRRERLPRPTKSVSMSSVQKERDGTLHVPQK